MSQIKRTRFNLDSLRSRLLLLVALALLPPVGLTVYGAVRERKHAIDVAESNLQRLTGLAAAGEAKSIEGARQFLLALSDVPDLMRGPQQCAALLQTLLKKNPGYLNLGVADTEGDVLCSARPLSPSGKLSRGDRANLARTLASGRFSTGDYVANPGATTRSITASYPILDENRRIVALAFAVIDLNSLDHFVTDIDFPPNAVMITADGNGTIVARRPHPEQWVGIPVTQKLFDLMVKVRFGTAEIIGADGIARLHAFAAVGGPDMSNFTVSIGIPTADIVAAANREQATALLTLLVTAALALLTAWFAANLTILDRVHALLAATRRIADGDLETRSGIRYGREEISALAMAFDRMAMALQRSAAERDEAQAHLFAEKERAQVTLESIGDAVISTDRDGNIDYLNSVAEGLTGWPAQQALGQPLAMVLNVIDGTSRAAVPSLVELAPEHGRIDGAPRDSVLIGRDGSEHAIEESATPIRDRDQQIIGTVVVFHDVSQSRTMARQLSHQASHDPLTGLVNRREFERRLQRTLEHSVDPTRQHALLFLDLDRFKVVNDTCGHNAGDELLCQVTALLQPLLRESDTLARVGGDEFAALLENCTPASAARIADKLCKTVCAFRFAWRDQVFPIGVSIGLVDFSSSDFGGSDPSMSELLSAADHACYRAKDAGRNRVHSAHASTLRAALPGVDNSWQNRIRDALAHQRFMLLSQEVRALGVLGGPQPHYEILLCMLDEQGTRIPPSAFLPAAERNGLMMDIERWMMRNAFAYHATLQRPRTAARTAPAATAVGMDGPGAAATSAPFASALQAVRLKAVAATSPPGARTWPDAGEPIVCAIGVSASALNDSGFLGFLSGLFAEFSLDPRSVCFEIAETTAIAHLAKTMHFIEVLKPLGCLFALDDFGSGMSSFAYLAHLKVDFLKIDGSFIRELVDDPIDQAKVEAINHVAHAMGVRTIAKHVADQETVDRLRAMRVDYVQGEAVAAPVQVVSR